MSDPYRRIGAKTASGR